MIRMKDFPWIWIVILGLSGVDCIWLRVAEDSVPLNSLAPALGMVGLLMAVSVIYSTLRPDFRLALLTQYAAQLLAYSVSLGIFSYLAVTLRFPLIDAQLNAADQAVGFDWLSTYRWCLAHPILKFVLSLAYSSVVVQMGVLMTLLVSLRRYDRAQSFMWIYIVSSISYILIAALWPAVGAFSTYHVALETPYVKEFWALYDGSMTSFNILNMQGVVQFPSFHLTLAVLCSYAVRGIKIWFPLITLLNMAVIAATPAIGGHYLSDLWSSLFLTALVIAVVDYCLRAYNSTKTGT